MVEPYKPPINLPDGHMRMVGIIAAQWEWIEIVLERAVAEVMTLKHAQVGLLTVNLSFRAKCDLILVYARPLETEDNDSWKKFTKVIESLKAAYTLRNAYVHAKWKINERTGKLGRTSVRTMGGRLALVDEETKIEDMERDAKAIWDAAEHLGALLTSFGLLQQS
jgi:hypothetical protein